MYMTATSWVETPMMVPVGMFERFGLQKNLGKAKAMVCPLGSIFVHQGDAAYKRRTTG